MAEEPKFTIRLAKIKNNRLLDRIQMVCDVYYEPRVKITKEHIRKKIAHQFKKPNVVIFSAKKAFGGGRIRCFAMVYDSEDSMKKYESAKRLARIEREKDPKNKKVEKKKEGRKVLKVKKHQRQKKRGTARRQNINLERKQKKKK